MLKISPKIKRNENVAAPYEGHYFLSDKVCRVFSRSAIEHLFQEMRQMTNGDVFGSEVDFTKG